MSQALVPSCAGGACQSITGVEHPKSRLLGAGSEEPDSEAPQPGCRWLLSIISPTTQAALNAPPGHFLKNCMYVFIFHV